MRSVRTHCWQLIAAALVSISAFGFQAQAQQDKPVLSLAPGPWPQQPSEYGAIAFTPDGSYTSTWKRASKTEAEDKVRAECTGLAHGKCEVLSFGPDVCAALASAQISKQRKVTYSGGGMTRAAAEKVALLRCNADRRARGSCEMRTVLCGDGR